MAAKQTLRRMPLADALPLLRAGEGSAPLASSVKALSFRYVAKNSEPGPRDFLRAIAPRIAYANPALPFAVERIRDPRSKSINPKSPDAGAEWEGGEMPSAQLVIAFHEGPEKSIPVRHLSAEQIWQQIVEVGGLAPPEEVEAEAKTEKKSKGKKKETAEAEAGAEEAKAEAEGKAESA